MAKRKSKKSKPRNPFALHALIRHAEKDMRALKNKKEKSRRRCRDRVREEE